MCTVSFLPFAGPAGYLLAMNRDESRERKIARRVRRGDGFLYPEDADALGTWVGVNLAGFSFCLLNQHLGAWKEKPGAVFVSRGQIIPQLLRMGTRGEIRSHMRELALTEFRPFKLLLMAREGPVEAFTWHGSTLAETELPRVASLFVSSTFGDLGAVAAREELFHGAIDGQEISLPRLRALHRTHAPDFGPRGFCIHHPYGLTVSSTDFSVTEGRIEFRYERAPLCERETSAEPASERIVTEIL